MRTTLLILLSLSLSGLSWTHEYHVSITQLDYNTATSTIQVSIKLHDEDVELLLDKNIEGTSYLEKDLSRKEVDDFLLKYLNASFSILHNGAPVALNFIGKELEQGDLWIYLESPVIAGMLDLEVQNTLFLELFDDQSNMVHYSKDNQIVQSCVMNKIKRTHAFSVE
jgi:hypothetical protein